MFHKGQPDPGSGVRPNQLKGGTLEQLAANRLHELDVLMKRANAASFLGFQSPRTVTSDGGSEADHLSEGGDCVSRAVVPSSALSVAL